MAIRVTKNAQIAAVPAKISAKRIKGIADNKLYKYYEYVNPVTNFINEKDISSILKF
jgi:hypothetical protein